MGWKPFPLEASKNARFIVKGIKKVPHRVEIVYDPTWGRKPFLANRGYGRVYNQTVIPKTYKRKPDIEPVVKSELNPRRLNAAYVKWLWSAGWDRARICAALKVKDAFVYRIVGGFTYCDEHPLKPPGLDV